jgi:predicted MFS family arabinose efflux permease
MVVIPYAASKAPDATRGRTIGQIMTGLLLGILLARAVSGFVALWARWRSMYLLAAAGGSVWAVLIGGFLLDVGTRIQTGRSPCSRRRSRCSRTFMGEGLPPGAEAIDMPPAELHVTDHGPPRSVHEDRLA